MSKKGARPHLWLVGSDPDLHDQYTAWHRARAQAHYRGEPWQLTFDEWVEFWGDDWPRRGRRPGDLRMTRLDWERPWCRDNMAKMDQQQHNAHNAERRRR